ncbi:MAG: FAD-binding oxidoreductase [Desulfurococcales archaeon]|nr:FAD-binding oxidoreductase [Desulfurococcales archaeon]
MAEFDYVIVGSGIIGLATAYHLSQWDNGARILVVDKAPGPAAGDTSKSAAAFRVFFTSRVNMALAGSSVAFYEHVQESGYSLDMRFVGYLFLADKHRMEEIKPGLAHADKMGLDYKVLEPGYLEENLGVRTSVEGTEEAELLDARDIIAGILIPRAGTLMPDKLANYYYEKNKGMGVVFAFNEEVREFLLEPRKPIGIEGEPLPWQDKRVSGVRTSSGREFTARKKVIVAAGAWTPYLLEPIGVDSFTRPKKRQIFAIKAETGEQRKVLYAKGFNKYGAAPMTILPNMAYLRPTPEEGSFWAGYSDDLGRPFKLEEDPVAEESYYIYTIHPLVTVYFPQFEGARPTSMWAGHYDLSPDKQPVVCEYNGSDLVISAGTSGSGILKADAIGRVTAGVALGWDEVELFDGSMFKVKWLSYIERHIEREYLVI